MFIKVAVKTGAKNEALRKISDSKFVISVREKPEHNAANDRIVVLIARHFRIPTASVRITKGHHRPSKILAIRGASSSA
jgi:uncharacterized protein YggU (UPF0235/DUF167 family)